MESISGLEVRSEVATSDLGCIGVIRAESISLWACLRVPLSQNLLVAWLELVEPCMHVKLETLRVNLALGVHIYVLEAMEWPVIV